MTETPQPSRRRRIAGERRSQAARRQSPAETHQAPMSVPAGHPVSETIDLRTADEPPRSQRRAAASGRQVPASVALAAVVVSVLLAGLALGYGLPRYLDVRAHNADEASGRAAQAAAERAALAIMSYGYKTLDADEQAAMKFMSASMAKTYQETFDASVKPNAPSLKANVTASLLASGVVNVTGDRADILLYANQTTVSTANGGDPQVAENRVVFRMVKVDGSWLVDEITPK